LCCNLFLILQFLLGLSKVYWIIQSNMGYLKDTLKGMSWMGGLRVATRAVAFAKIAILARILIPAEFGIFGIASLVLALLEILTETGVNIFLIQEKVELENYINTTWIVSIVRGIFICLLLFILAPFIAIFFKTPDAVGIIRVISVVPLLRGFINPGIIKFQKELLFSKEFIMRFTIFFFDGAIAIFFAIATRSAISLVAGLIAGSALEVIISHMLIRPRPRFEFDIEKLKSVIKKGKWVTISGIFNYLFENIDDAVVGRLLNAGSLGLYQMAYKISSLPLTEVADVVQKVTFPVYVKISEDPSRIKKAFGKSILATAILVIPFGFIFILFPETIVRIILGEKWLEISNLIRIMSFFGVLRALTAVTYPLFLSFKRQDLVSLITFIAILGLGITIIPLVKTYGIVGAGISSLTGAIFAIPTATVLVKNMLTKQKYLKLNL